MAWTNDPFGSGGGRATGIVLDRHGDANIVWWGAGPDGAGSLDFAKQNGSSWMLEKVDDHTAGSRGIALDAQDSPHLVYVRNGARYAHKANGTWQKELVASNVGNAGVKIAISQDGSPWVVIGGFTVQVATRNSTGVWVRQLVDTPAPGNDGVDLAFDSLGRLHVAYSDINAAILRHAVRQPDGTWAIEAVVPGCSWRVSMAIDAMDHPHIACYNFGPATISYVHWDGSAWQSETLSGEPVNRAVSFTPRSPGLDGLDIAVDSAGRAHVAYSTGYNPFDPNSPFSPSHLRHAVKTPTGWQVEEVDGSGNNVGPGASITLDAQGRPHISYALVWANYGSVACDNITVQCPSTRYAEPLAATVLGATGN